MGLICFDINIMIQNNDIKTIPVTLENPARTSLVLSIESIS